ncbi:MAG TPA: hypothetical protein VFM97_00555 [Gammaproteobacteria bacterium]|nr:hypothetical protein [Gammaproteobacteria bacterium]
MALGTTEFEWNNVDLKAVFEPRQAGDAAVAATGYFDTDDGKDLADIFAPLAVGTRIAGNTGYSVNGTDLADIFAAIHSRPDSPLAASLPATVGATCGTSGSTCTAQAVIKVSAGGGFPAYTYAWTVNGATIVSGHGTDTLTIEADPTDAANVQATVSCTVSDSQNGVVTTNDCAVTFSLVYESDLAASLPVSANAECSSSADSCVASVDVPVLVSKGKAPYSFEWQIVSGSCSFQNGTVNQSPATIARSTSGSPQAVVRCKVTDASGKSVLTNNCTVTFQYSFINNLAVTIPDNVSGDCSTSGSNCWVTERVTATVRGGKPPYTYDWEYVSGGAFGSNNGFAGSYIDVTNATSGNESVTFRVKVTDSLGYSVYSNNCTFTSRYHYVSDLAVSAPSSASDTCSTTSSSCVASAQVTCSVSGGKKPYTFLWQAMNSPFTLTNRDSQTCTVAKTVSGSFTAIVRCKVTDASGAVRYTNNCSVALSYSYSGGSGGCVVVDGVTPTGRIGDIAVGDVLEGMDPVTFDPLGFRVTYSEPKKMPCVLVTTASGIQIPCSESAQIATRAGWVLATKLLGHEVPIDDFGDKRFDAVIEIGHLGMQWVQHVAAQDGWFWAGRHLPWYRKAWLRMARLLTGRPWRGSGQYLLHHNKIATFNTLPK